MIASHQPEKMKSQNPRRGRVINTPPSLSSPDLHLSVRLPFRLKKGETFHSTSPSDRDSSPVSLSPRRSSTSPGALQAFQAGQERMAKILSRLDLNSTKAPAFDDYDDFPVPKGSLKALVEKSQVEKSQPRKDDLNKDKPSPPKESTEKTRNVHCHPSDSGLGTSVSSCQTASSQKVKVGPLSQDRSQATTGSINAVETETTPEHKLGLGTCLEIERRILTPLLGQDTCKPFHHLVESAREQIAGEKIRTLRDLEKALLYVAADVEVEIGSYYQFCSSTILCLHETYTHVNPRDLCLPADKPYSNSYFLDLTAQVHRFKTMRDEARKNKKDMEPQLILEGGLSATGRPLELVAQKDGESISLQTGKPFDELAPPLFKRTLSLGDGDEGARRSMARRKKNAPPMNINTKCSHCDKIFQRPCDLTKHEKTHSRPFKCPFEGCKYYDLGWPTEKENERHINDRHSTTPRMYACTFGGCAYKSKRESNCKQHMEKAHGWNYVRAKNNGRNGKRRATPVGASPDQDSSVESSPAQSSPDQMGSVPLAPAQMASLHQGSTQMNPLQMSPDQLNLLQMNADHMSPLQLSPDHLSPLHMGSDRASPVEMNALQMSPDRGSSVQMSPPQVSPAQLSTPATGPLQSPTGYVNNYSQGQMFQLQDPYTQLKNEDCVLYTDNDFAPYNNGANDFFEDASFGYGEHLYQTAQMDIGGMGGFCEEAFMNSNLLWDGNLTDEGMFILNQATNMPPF
ncbi:C2H2 transcription factor [Aspergillus heteromorphus CBS 117.55]|uniref:C2H2 transcription factor n=1 Tax=Aspergillus heteromorphus CBS 117.55 TaxID=1448321 RepID=A0A317X2X5_9EURO|nr:C2H2 transcription factor [Aspergillus heteromorphus CBS 117.55]PWY92685.1 C2H2 transcription factor [Aspergillus heteromorphus CBS 117.55]